MLISKKISDFIVFETEAVLHALQKINANKKRILFVVGENGRLLGSFSDGDFRRWILNAQDIDLNTEMSRMAHSEAVFCKVDAPRNVIQHCFTKPGVDVVPLVDEYGRLISLAFAGEEGFVIGERVISETEPAYIIAEIGNNHQGDFAMAKRLVKLAVDAGADCVKFQMRNMAELYQTAGEQNHSDDLGAQYTKDLLGKFQLSNDELIGVFDYVKSLGCMPLCTPWDKKSLMVLEDYGMAAYKVASADFTNVELLEALIATGKPLICSTGMCSEDEIKRSVKLLKEAGANFVLLHCNSTYPTPFKDVNLAYLQRLKDISDRIVGYSGHERGIEVPIAAVALGAKVVEKHFTVDKDLEGNDHKVSLLPEEFKLMVAGIRNVEQSMGASKAREITQGEMMNREVLAKSIIASRAISKGETITREMLAVKSPGQGLQPLYMDQLVGKTANREVSEGGYFYESDLSGVTIAARPYTFNRPFGIPVRYHDYQTLTAKSNLDFVEFHLSYQDLALDLSQFFSGPQAMGFAVHSPELFEGDHLLNLCAADADYRSRSIAELNRVCDVTRTLKAYFPQTSAPAVVVNAGGFSSTGFLAPSERARMYSLIADSLQQVDTQGVVIAIQTMPPFPWHFGGQSYHNLFVDPQEIVAFCQQTGMKVCFDVSHSMMACNYYHWDLLQFTRTVLPYVVHMHIVDALGIDGEGVQIGEGDVDFVALAQILNELAPGTQFIPEVWQGHKNEGQGFWHALEFLERYL